MIRRLVFTYLAVTMFGLALLAIPLGLTFAHREKDRLLFDAQRDADTVAARVEDSLEARAPLPADSLAAYANQTRGHIIVVDTHGVALVDTDHPTQQIDYSSRPEIKLALQGHRASGTGDPLGAATTSVYAATPATAETRVIGAVRVTFGTATLDARVRRMWEQIALLCGGILVAVLVAGFLLARSITRPIYRLESATDRFANGDLSARVDIGRNAGPPELRHLTSSFNRMADRLTRLLDEQKRFVADASHQLRTPLTALRLRLENLASHGSHRDRAALDAAGAEVVRMSRLVDGLLVLARDDAKVPELVPVDVAAVVRERVELWQDAVTEKDVRLRADLPDRAQAYAIAGAVEQLVDNLIDNALTASPADTEIVVSVRSAPGSVTLHVVDEGPGLDPENIDRAFDRFWRGPNAAAGGSGLGLAIVRRLAEASRGSARLRPTPAGGIDAAVALPTSADGVV